MKRQLFLLALFMSVMTVAAREGALKGLFSINADGDQVCFSQGNLQYRATTGTWRFAENQTDFIGKDNDNAGATYDGWIDLMPYGSSGFDNNRMPYDKGKFLQQDIAGTNYDWGQYCAITNGGNSPGLWFTMTDKEARYLIFDRPNADELRSLATVKGVEGMILLPDDWSLPQGIAFTPLAQDFETNSYPAQEWALMEEAGAVFLPYAGRRYKNELDMYEYSRDLGAYWTSTIEWCSEFEPGCFPYYVAFGGPNNIYRGVIWSDAEDLFHADESQFAVRLVRDNIADEKTLTGRFSVSADEQVQFAQGNLQYRASTDQWQFAEDQWDIIGKNNEYISETYTGWIDLFGWGTSGYANKNPWMTSDDEYDYTDGTTNDIAGTYFDWGKYNAIVNGGNTAGLWRTMTLDEWDYLLNTRPDATRLQGIATIASNRGYVLLPDDWVLPDRMWFAPMAVNFDINTYTVQQWRTMEEAGAVFLPTTGFRQGRYVSDADECSEYWTATSEPDDVMMSGSVGFCYIEGNPIEFSTNYTDRTDGRAIRLVRKASAQGIDNVQRDHAPSTKLLRDGQLIIRHGDKEYNAQGQRMK